MIPKKDKMAAAIYRHFQKKFSLGEIGLIQSCCIASMMLKEQKAFSLIVVAPSGQMKSTIIEDTVRMFPEHTVQIESRHTPTGLAREYGETKLNNKTWINNDMVRTFTGITRIKIEEIVGFYAELMSEKTSGSATAFSSKLKNCKMNMIGNIAMVSYKKVEDKFISSTFAERIMFTSYIRDKNTIRYKTDKKLKLCNQLLGIKLEPSSIKPTKEQKKKIYEMSDKLTRIAHYEKFSMRPDEIVESFLCSYALLNKRSILTKTDFEVFEWLMPYFKRII